ncbi:MAG TPA: helix-turn-helix domain-containing protein [Ktedonobacterales bacterium]|jgi:hypothetical protein|nr:helix-turn-helix domain-containing protein [Ktedonobacterales bacterium]
MAGESEERYISASEAARELGVSRKKIADLIKTGELPTKDDPLDKRVKLIAVSAVEELKRSSRGKGLPAVAA